MREVKIHMTDLTIFDLDNTLLGGDSDHAWGEFLAGQGIVDPEVHMAANNRFYEQYKNQTLDIIEYQSFVLKPLVGMSEADRKALHNDFMITKIAPLRLAKADALIERHRQAGDVLLVITATNRFVAGPIIESMGIENILATDPEIVDGLITGNIVGTPCFQEGKISRLNTWLASQGFTPKTVTFYSDSINDRPLLEVADKPVVVDPDDRLRTHAETVGWPIISLR